MASALTATAAFDVPEHGVACDSAAACVRTTMSSRGATSAAVVWANSSEVVKPKMPGQSDQFAQPPGTVYVRPPNFGCHSVPGAARGVMYCDEYVPASMSPRQPVPESRHAIRQ